MRKAFTLFELMVSVAIIAALVAILVPSVRAMRKSYESTGAEGMVNSALASARAIAIREHKYAGIRFQLEYAPTKKVFDRSQYMVFVVYEEPRKMGNLGDGGFRAVDGLKPMKLPSETMVMDLNLRTGDESSTNYKAVSSDSDFVATDLDKNIVDMASFSIIVSPAGRVVTYQVRVRNRDGFNDPLNSGTKISWDNIFNSPNNIEQYHVGLLAQDDYKDLGLGAEKSKSQFWQVSKGQLKSLCDVNPPRAWTDYLEALKPVFVNAYTGEIIKNQ